MTKPLDLQGVPLAVAVLKRSEAPLAAPLLLEAPKNELSPMSPLPSTIKAGKSLSIAFLMKLDRATVVLHTNTCFALSGICISRLPE